MPKEKPSKAYMTILIIMFVLFAWDLPSPAAGVLPVLFLVVLFAGVAHITLAAFFYYMLFWAALRYAGKLTFAGAEIDMYAVLLVIVLMMGHFYWRCLGCVSEEEADPYMRKTPPGH